MIIDLPPLPEADGPLAAAVEDSASALTRPTLRHLLPELHRLVDEAQRIDLLRWERTSLGEVRGDLVPIVSRLCEAARTTLSDIGDGLEEHAPDDAEDGRWEAVRNVAWMARVELAQRCEQLAGAHRIQGLLPLLALCDSCLRKLRRTAGSVEAALAPLAGAAPRFRPEDGLSLSRRIRALYAGFRRQIETAADRDLEMRLRRASAALARLVGRDVFRDLRISDRAEFARLQQRLAAYFRRSDQGRDEEGEHLWQDVVAFSALLHGVNRRAELVEHDRAVVAAALAALRRLPDGAPLADGLRVPLATLRGRDEEVDTLLDLPAASRGVWIEALERLQREIHGSRDLA